MVEIYIKQDFERMFPGRGVLKTSTIFYELARVRTEIEVCKLNEIFRDQVVAPVK